MRTTYILTDSSVQFTRHTFPGRNQIEVIPFHILLDQHPIENDVTYKTSQIPQSIRNGSKFEILAPSVNEFTEKILEISNVATDIIAILMSSQLSKACENMERAIENTRGKVQIQLVDSQTTGIGLGFLVQLAAELASRHHQPDEIEYIVRGRIPHIYSQFCLPNMTFLYQTGIMGYPQAIVGEMLNLLPIFSFEEGRMISVEKVRNNRQLQDNFQEFLDEFSDLENIAFMQSTPPMLSEARSLKEHAAMMFAKTPFSEHVINPVLASLFGPHSVGIFAIENPSN
jgi:DegV family protein with EDD domain